MPSPAWTMPRCMRSHAGCGYRPSSSRSARRAASSRTAQRGAAKTKDAGTFQLIWLVITLAIVAGIVAGNFVPRARIPATGAIYPYAFALFVLGMALRAWSIRTLGRFFTVQVAIAGDHRLI